MKSKIIRNFNKWSFNKQGWYSSIFFGNEGFHIYGTIHNFNKNGLEKDQNLDYMFNGAILKSLNEKFKLKRNSFPDFTLDERTIFKYVYGSKSKDQKLSQNYYLLFTFQKLWMMFLQILVQRMIQCYNGYHRIFLYQVLSEKSGLTKVHQVIWKIWCLYGCIFLRWYCWSLSNCPIY